MLDTYCTPDVDGRCERHGGPIGGPGRRCWTEHVLALVSEERERQYQHYGTNEDLEDGTGRRVRWLQPLSPRYASGVQREFRRDYENHEAEHGKPTWMHLVREEVAEAFQEDDPDRLAEELIQVAALCVSWVEKIRSRQ